MGAHAPSTGGGGSEVTHGNSEPRAGSNEQVFVVCFDSDPYVGTIKFTFGGQETSAINLETASGSDAAARLEALSTIGAGNIECISGDSDILADNGGEWDFEFIGDLAAQDVGLVSVTSISATANGVAMTTDSFEVDNNDGSPASPSGDELLYIQDTGVSPAILFQKVAGVWRNAIDSNTVQLKEEKGAASGYAALDSDGLLPLNDVPVLNVISQNGPPSAAPSSGQLPLSIDVTAVTGGAYYWNSTSWIKFANAL